MPAPPRVNFDCLSCDCYVAEGPMNGTCHNEPPKGNIVQIVKEPITQQPQPLVMSIYSPVGKGHWCSRHPKFEQFRELRRGVVMMGEFSRLNPNGDTAPATPEDVVP